MSDKPTDPTAWPTGDISGRIDRVEAALFGVKINGDRVLGLFDYVKSIDKRTKKSDENFTAYTEKNTERFDKLRSFMVGVGVLAGAVAGLVAAFA